MASAPEFFLTGFNCTICNASVVIRGMGGRQPSSLLAGRLTASLEDSDWLEFLQGGLLSLMNLGSRGGAGGGSDGGKKGGGAGKGGEALGRGGLRAVGGGERHLSVGEQKGARASGGGGGNTGEGGRGEPSEQSARGGGGGRKGDLSARQGEGRGGRGGGGARGEARAASSFFTAPPPSVEVLEERDVDEEETDTEEIRDDFLSGTLGLAFPFPFAGDIDFKNTGTGVSAVGVLDWLEYPLDGEVTLCDFSGEVMFGFPEPPGTWGIGTPDPSGMGRTGPFPVGASPRPEPAPGGFPGSSCKLV